MPFRLPTLVSRIALLVVAACAPGALHANPSIVVDARSGEVLHADEATRPWHPASTTKMMTAYMLLKAVREGRLTMETPLTASRNAASQRPSKIGIKPGQVITADNALKIMMVRSANDVAVVIAENLGGSVPAFANAMNTEARRLGMSESYFTNANGWHDARQRTSARDLAILARALWYEFPEYRGYWGIGSLQLGSKVIKNTNGLVGRYPGIVGMKTGFVCASGFNLVSMADVNGRLLISVVLGASSGPERVVASARLLDEAAGGGGFFGRSTGYTLANLPRSGYSQPTNVRGEVCGKGRRAFSLTEEESDAPVVYDIPQNVANTSPLAILMRDANRSSGSVRRSAGRLSLGERVLGTPIPVFLGRAAGSDAVPVAAILRQDAQAEPEPVAPATAAAIAPRRAPRPLEEEPVAAEEAGEPLMLTGVEPAETPAAAASLAPKAKARLRKDAKPGAIAGSKPKAAEKAPAKKASQAAPKVKASAGKAPKPKKPRKTAADQ
jgi:D-alanyl-D-alanine carboxypeptidase